MADQNQIIQKLLIFKSLQTGAVYSWNCKEVVCIAANPLKRSRDGALLLSTERKAGQIMQGIRNEELKKHKNKQAGESFKVMAGEYTVLANINFFSGILQYR